MDLNLFIFSLLFLLSSVVGNVAGFGSAVICLTLGAHLFPIETMVPVIVPLNLISSFILTVKHWKRANWPILLRIMLPQTLLGLIVGIALAPHIQGNALKFIFGVYVLYFAVFGLSKELILTLRKKENKTEEKSGALMSSFFLLSGGVLQGIYSTGGPMVVSYASKAIPDKHKFRSSLSILWTVLNSIMLVSFVATDRIDSNSLIKTAWLLPAVFLGVAAGDALHKRVSQRAFRILVFIILTISGLALLWS